MKKILTGFVVAIALMSLVISIASFRPNGKKNISKDLNPTVAASILDPSWKTSSDWRQIKEYVDLYLGNGYRNYCGDLKSAIDKCVALYIDERPEILRGPAMNNELEIIGWCWGCRCESGAPTCNGPIYPGCGWMEWYGCHVIPSTCGGGICPTCGGNPVCTVVGRCIFCPGEN